MKTILKHTFRSVKSNKGQFVVIIVTMAVITCMLFVALTVGDLFYNLQLSIHSRVAQSADIKMEGVFSEARLNEFYAENSDKIDYIDTYMQMGGLFRNTVGDDLSSKVILIEATELKQFYDKQAQSLSIYEYYEYSYQYPEVWVGKSFAQDNNIVAGDTVLIYLDYTNSYQKMTVTCIFENYGIFANSTVNNVLVDFSTVSSRGILTTAYIALGENVDRASFVATLQTFMDNSELTIGHAVDYAEINKVVTNNQKLLNVALVFIIALILFILFTSYLVMAKGRLNELVTFKTAGASNKQIIFMLLLEGIIYGAIGTVVGLLIGRAGMSFATSKVIPNFPHAVTYRVFDYIIVFALGIIISVVAALFPAIRASKDSVRLLISGSVKDNKKPPFYVAIISAVLIVACILFLVFMPNISIAVLVIMLAVIAILIFAVMPYIIYGISYLFGLGKGMFKVSSFGIKRNIYTQTLSSLIGSVMVFTFLVVSIINVIVFAIKPYNERFASDYVVESVDNVDLHQTAKNLQSVHGVKYSYHYGYDTFLWDNGNLYEQFTVYGVSEITAIDYISDGVSVAAKQQFLDTVNPVIVSYDLIQRFSLSIGQTITLHLGNKEMGKKKPLSADFTVVGIDYAMTQNDRVMIINYDSFVVDKEKYTPSKNMIFVIASDDVPSKDLYYDLRDKLEGTAYILEYNDWAYATSVGIRGVITLLNILQIMISLVAFIGIINLTIVSLLERKREFNILKSVGMDTRKYGLLSISDGLITAMSGGVIGFILSLLINRLMPSFAHLIDRYLVQKWVPSSIIIIVFVVIMIYSLVYFILAITNKKLKVIERNIL